MNSTLKGDITKEFNERINNIDKEDRKIQKKMDSMDGWNSINEN